MRKPSTRTLALTAVLTLSALLLAGAGHAARRPAAPALAKRVVERLDLTPEQVQEIRAILASYKPELAAELARVKDTRSHLFETIHGDTFDEAAIRSAGRAVGQAETELAVTRGEIVTEVREVLTPEQQAEAREMLADARAFVEEILSRLRERLESDPLSGI